jgi:hypothetical protein
MKKIIILAIIFAIICVSEGFSLVVTNKCETCSYIDVDLNGFNDESAYEYYDGHLGGYDTSLNWPVPAGTYDFHGLCESGASKGFVWIDSITSTGSLLIDKHNLLLSSTYHYNLNFNNYNYNRGFPLPFRNTLRRGFRRNRTFEMFPR